MTNMLPISESYQAFFLKINIIFIMINRRTFPEDNTNSGEIEHQHIL